MEGGWHRLAAHIWFSRMVSDTGIGMTRARRMVARLGSVEAVYAAGAADLTTCVPLPPENVARLRRYAMGDANRQRAEDAAQGCASAGVRCATEGEAEYPGRLREISSRPFCLFYRGDIETVLCRAEGVVTVIGTRSPSGYGKTATRKIATEIAQAGITVVSGLARGIDSIAHRAALEAGGLTAAVLGGGIDHVYPPEHKGLMEEIAARGVVLSEHGPGVRPVKSFFAARNRILSGLADCVAVTEASEYSGTMITAGFAADQGRDLFAVPGSIFEPGSRGCNRLIREGADVLTEAEDLLYRLPMGRMPRTAECEVKEMAQAAQATRILDGLRGQSLTPEELSRETGIPVATLLPLLSALEWVGDVECRRGRFTLTPVVL